MGMPSAIVTTKSSAYRVCSGWVRLFILIVDGSALNINVLGAKRVSEELDQIFI